MSITRATGKAYRIPYHSLLLWLGYLSPTNAEEMIHVKRKEVTQYSTKALDKQVSYIEHLCDSPMRDSLPSVLTYIKGKYGADDLKDMTKDEASEVIELILSGDDQIG